MKHSGRHDSWANQNSSEIVTAPADSPCTDEEGAIARAARNTWLFSARLGEREAWTTPQSKEQERRVLEAVQDGRDPKDAAELRERYGKEVRDVATKEAAGQHWEHAYATTVYKSQGMTKQHVLVNAEASQKELMSQKAFLVSR
ncbi:hypothetical protein [Sinimarinibacterium thermocellulolyticum]|uniref:Uncharacterized protein n=1 Tax=Sinimarinibacterium thermocellulolyticum TaxID=3170016 RepID=A0ABV2A8Y1_9GAMM